MMRRLAMMRRRIPTVTAVILVINILCFIYEMVNGVTRTAYAYAMYEGAIQDGEYLRVIASAFFHYDFFHIASNMLCLVLYGIDLEYRVGPKKFLIIYAVSVLGSGLLVNFAGGRALHMGASGAIWGLMTATLINNMRNGINFTYALRGIVLNLVYSFSAGVSWQGHIGGGIAGLAAALVLCKGPYQRNRFRRVEGRVE